MVDTLHGHKAERRQLQQIIAGLTEGVILIDPDQTIAWANEAALRMHGAREVADLGRDVDEYRRRYQLRYRNNHPLQEGPIPPTAWWPARCSPTSWWRSRAPGRRNPNGSTACAASS